MRMIGIAGLMACGVARAYDGDHVGSASCFVAVAYVAWRLLAPIKEPAREERR